MRAWMLALVAGAGLGTAACQPSYADACYGVCKKSGECQLDRDLTKSEQLTCRAECESEAESVDEALADGTVTEACYDAAVDLLGCAKGLSCTLLLGSEVPDECKDELERRNEECPEAGG
ncbi:MAG: hypothetical protein KC933_02005 [Myxococcales bacterium]|nr:hypothetical protein [Myxococcales bacterium]MCB9647288.1 hypothetical protein [Deltaproteobacteria bacterium]